MSKYLKFNWLKMKLEMRKRKLKGGIGIFYLLLSIIFFQFSRTANSHILSYIGFSCLGLTIRAFIYVYIQWNEKPLLDEEVRDCLVNYLFYYPLLVSVIFVLVYLFNDKYNIAKLDLRVFNLLSFYAGFDIARLANKVELPRAK